MQDLAATVEALLAEMPAPIAPVSRRRELATRIADAWQGAGGTHEGIEPFVRYWVTFTNDLRSVLRKKRASARRGATAALRMCPKSDDAA